MIDAARYLSEQAQYGGWPTPAHPEPDRLTRHAAREPGLQLAIRASSDDLDAPDRQPGWISMIVFVVVAGFLASLLTAALVVGVRDASGESTATTASAADVVPNRSNAVSPGTR